MPTVWGQFNIMLVTLATGLVLGIIFDFYRAFTGFVQIRGVILNLGDLLLWLISAGSFFVVLLLMTGGELRFFNLLALLVGFIIYRQLMGNTMYTLFRSIFNAVCRCLRRLAAGISYLGSLAGRGMQALLACGRRGKNLLYRVSQRCLPWR